MLLHMTTINVAIAHIFGIKINLTKFLSREADFS